MATLSNIDAIRRELAELGGVVDTWAGSPPQAPAREAQQATKALQSTTIPALNFDQEGDWSSASGLKREAGVVTSEQLLTPLQSAGAASPQTLQQMERPRLTNYVNPARRSLSVSGGAMTVLGGSNTARSNASASTAATSSSSLQQQLKAINQAQIGGASTKEASGDNLYARAEVYRLKKEEARRKEEEMAKSKAKPQLNA
jgi:hypothetical protein